MKGLWRLLWVGIASGTLLLAAGFFPWPAEGLFQEFARRVELKTGWHLEVRQARWIPWRHLELEDLKLETPRGGRLHIVNVQGRSSLWPLFQEVLATHWEIGEIRMDPGSFRIRKPLAQELLSALPVTDRGAAFLEVRRRGVTLNRLTLTGPFLRLHARGWAHSLAAAHLEVEGQLAQQILEAMDLLRSDRSDALAWEPFQIRLDGKGPVPQFSFVSNFFSVSWAAHPE